MRDFQSRAVVVRLLAKNVGVFSKDSQAAGENHLGPAKSETQFWFTWRAEIYFTDVSVKTKRKKNV